MTANERIRNWIANKDIRQVLLGEDGCFVPDPTFREKHDVLLILNQALAMIRESCLDSQVFKKRLASGLAGIADDAALADVVRCIVIAEGDSEKERLIDREYISDLVTNRLKQRYSEALGRVVDIL